MAMIRFVHTIFGLSTDTKPSPVNGFQFFEFDTGKAFIANGTTWVDTTIPTIDSRVTATLVGAVADGEVVMRSGSSLVGAATDAQSRRYMQSMATLGSASTTFLNTGITVTGSSAVTNADDSDGGWRSISSTSGTTVNFTSSGFRCDWLPDVVFRIKTDATLPADGQFVGLFDSVYGSAFGQFDGANAIGLRYCPIVGVGDTGATWKAVSNNGGGTATVAATTLAIAVSTVYVLRIQWTSTTSVTIHRWTGTAWATLATVTATLPSVTAYLLAVYGIQEPGGVARKAKLNKVFLSLNG